SHVGHTVLKAWSDEHDDAPEDHQQLGTFALQLERAPHRQANQDVAQNTCDEKSGEGAVHFGFSALEDKLHGFFSKQIAPAHQQGKEKGPQEISDVAEQKNIDTLLPGNLLFQS